MKKRTPVKKSVTPKVLLQARVLMRTGDESMYDVTQDGDNYGLKSLASQSSVAENGLLRITELLQVLALAAEKRSTVDANLVQRILDEVNETLHESGEVSAFVSYIRELFEESEALPSLDEAEMRKAFHSLALVS